MPPQYRQGFLQAFEVVEGMLPETVRRRIAVQALRPAQVLDHVGLDFLAGGGIDQQGPDRVRTAVDAQRI
ncbi:MAG: hypothetical protein PVI46_00480 [Lysobacterales bacterium]